MEKLDLKHIQHYPIGTDNPIKIIQLGDEPEILRVNGIIDIEGALVICANGNDFDYNSDMKLLFRPMSDLYEEIDGEIGIAKLIHIASGADTSDIAKSEIIKTIDGYRVVYKSRIDSKIYNEATLEYRHGIWKFYWNGELASINQLQLFEYLFKYHFDVYGLIEKRLAIDVNTIKPP